MFNCAGHQQFDLFMLSEEWCELNYDWSTTLPIHQVNALIGWDAEIAMSNASGCRDAINIVCFYLFYYIFDDVKWLLIFRVSSYNYSFNCLSNEQFRASRHALRCNLLLRSVDIQRLVRLLHTLIHPDYCLPKAMTSLSLKAIL